MSQAHHSCINIDAKKDTGAKSSNRNGLMVTPEKRSVKEWLSALEAASKGDHYPALFKQVYALVAVPSRKRRAVSIFKINRATKDGDNVIVPRKVLSTGRLDHKVNIAALECSAAARRQIEASGGRLVPLRDMVTKDRISVIV